ncbi:MAG: hypothetical protein KC731_22210 [Myxococcales bacterium]|nr:hypothetical protein [Myxococcales bacterium]
MIAKTTNRGPLDTVDWSLEQETSDVVPSSWSTASCASDVPPRRVTEVAPAGSTYGAPRTIRPPNPLAELGYGSRPIPVWDDDIQDEDTEPQTPSFAPAVFEDGAPEPPLPSDSPPVDPTSLEGYARLRAAMDARPELRDDWLAEAGLDLDGWECLEHDWLERLAPAFEAGDPHLTEAYDEAYVARLEVERGPIDLITVARLELALRQQAFALVADALDIPREAFVRIRRVWTRRLLRDAELRDAFDEALTILG